MSTPSSLTQHDDLGHNRVSSSRSFLLLIFIRSFKNLILNVTFTNCSQNLENRSYTFTQPNKFSLKIHFRIELYLSIVNKTQDTRSIILILKVHGNCLHKMATKKKSRIVMSSDNPGSFNLTF